MCIAHNYAIRNMEYNRLSGKKSMYITNIKMNIYRKASCKIYTKMSEQ